MGGSKGEAGGPEPPPEKSIIVFLAILIQSLWKTKPAFNVEPSSFRQRFAGGPMMAQF